MGPFEGIGPYAEMSITTRNADGKKTDNKPGMACAIIGLFLLGPALWVVALMGLFCWAYIGLITLALGIGTALWACGHYGTKNSIFDRFRYRTTRAQNARIVRRLSALKEKRIS